MIVVIFAVALALFPVVYSAHSLQLWVAYSLGLLYALNRASTWIRRG